MGKRRFECPSPVNLADYYNIVTARAFALAAVSHSVLAA